MIETEKIAEILFEESRNIPEIMYIHTMNMLRDYPEVDNEAEFEQYILNFDKGLRTRIQKYITKPCCVCYMPDLPECDKRCRNFVCSCILGFIVLCIIGAVIWCIGTSQRTGYNSKINIPTNTTKNI
jgi:hypothetical protein